MACLCMLKISVLVLTTESKGEIRCHYHVNLHINNEGLDQYIGNDK